jgi:hypothetical protein
MIGDTARLMGSLGLFFMVWGTIAPVSTLSWWFGEGGSDLEERLDELQEAQQENSDAEAPRRCYVVFLAGVGNTSDQALADGETELLDELEAAHPSCVVVREVFPYSASTANIGGQALFDWLWEVDQSSDTGLPLARIILRTRNLWRVAISADGRYGEIYNQGIAVTILEQMNEAQPLPNNGTGEEPLRLILMGTSGGAQVALGAAPWLKETLLSDITVVSFGGVFDGTDGFKSSDRVFHLRGEADWTENIGGILFPSRWPWTFASPFNRARQDGRYQGLSIGPHEHDGDRGYFGLTEIENSGQSYLSLTIETVNALPIWPED